MLHKSLGDALASSIIDSISKMEKKVISFELTEEQYVQLESLAKLRKHDVNDVAKDVVCVFLSQIINPIVTLPHYE